MERPISPPPHLMMPEKSLPQSPEPGALAADNDDLKARIVSALKTVYDPEIPVDIYELGLIYRIDTLDNGLVDIDMTLTTPGCPVAGEMPGRVQSAVELVEGVSEAKVNLIWTPPWDRSRMSEVARVALNMF